MEGSPEGRLGVHYIPSMHNENGINLSSPDKDEFKCHFKQLPPCLCVDDDDDEVDESNFVCQCRTGRMINHACGKRKNVPTQYTEYVHMYAGTYHPSRGTQPGGDGVPNHISR